MRDLAPYVEAWRRRWAREASEIALRTDRARALAAQLAEVLRRDFGARRVWLIGSVARGHPGPRSDIDLVAEGLPPECLFRAAAALQRLAGDIEIDLAPLEDLRPKAYRDLQREGLEL